MREHGMDACYLMREVIRNSERIILDSYMVVDAQTGIGYRLHVVGMTIEQVSGRIMNQGIRGSKMIERANGGDMAKHFIRLSAKHVFLRC
jgi:hypothetical protein